MGILLGLHGQKFSSFFPHSPTGKKFRSRPQIISYLEETGSSLSIDDFRFNQKGVAGTPIRVRSTSGERKRKVTPKAKAKESLKKSPKKSPKKAAKKAPIGRPRKNSGGRSPSRAKKVVKTAEESHETTARHRLEEGQSSPATPEAPGEDQFPEAGRHTGGDV